MTVNTRFINSIITSAQSHASAMPWTRGAARRASLSRRRDVSQTTTTTVTTAAKSA